MDTYFHLAQGKVRMILYFRSEFQTSTSTSVLMATISELASTFTLNTRYLFMETYFNLAQDKVWIIFYLCGEFQTSTSISVPIAPISKLASTFTLSIIYAYLFSLSLEQSLDNSLTT